MTALVGLSEPVGDDLARLCDAIRSLDLDVTRAVAEAVPSARRTAVLAALAEVAPLFAADYRYNSNEAGAPTSWPTSQPLAMIRAVLAEKPSELAAALGALQATPASTEHVADLVAGRPGAWRARLVHALLHGRTRRWRWAHALVLAGLVDEPEDPEYARLMIGTDWRELPRACAADPSLGAVLQRLWALPDVGRHVGAAYSVDELRRAGARLAVAPDRSRRSDEEWAGLLEAWGAHDTDRRPAAVDGCLAALAGAGGTGVADLRGWGLVHGRLVVSLDEKAARQATYLDLAAGGSGPSAAVGRAVVDELLEAGALEPEALLDVTPDVLLRPEKVAVCAHLDLLARAVRTGLVAPGAVADAVVPALDHLPSGVGLVAARLLTLCGVEPAASPTPSEPPDARAWGDPAPVDLPAPGAVVPVGSMDELVDLLVQVTHGHGDALDLERAVDGMLRFREPRRGVEKDFGQGWDRDGSSRDIRRFVDAWRGAPRPRERWGSATRDHVAVRAEDVPADVEATHTVNYPVTRERQPDGTVVEHWSHQWRWEHTVPAWIPQHLVGARFQVAETQLQAPPAGLLALPSRQDGTIDADTLRTRLEQRRGIAGALTVSELVTALARVAPEQRAALRRAGVLAPAGLRWLDELEGERRWRWSAVEVEAWSGRPYPMGPLVLWQPDEPEADVPRADAVEPDADDGTFPWSRWFDTRSVVRNWADHHRRRCGDRELSGWALHLPSHPDVTAVHMQPHVIRQIEVPDADLSRVLSALGLGASAWGDPATGLVLWSASYKNVRTRAAAAESIALASRRGTLDGAALGRGIVLLVGPGAGPFLEATFHLEPEPPKLSRIAATLADAARIDEHGERAVLGAVVAALPHVREMRGGALLLEIAAGIVERRGLRVDLPPALADLAAGRSSTRMAQEARRLAGTGRTSTLWSPA